MLRKVVAAITPAVSLERAKDRLHILHDDSDQDIERLIEAATNVVEKETGAILQPSTWEHSGYWPCANQITLGVYPVRSIVSVKYTDNDDVELTLDPANYDFADLGMTFVSTWRWPWFYWHRPDPLRIRFTAGYDSTEDPTSDSEFTLPAECETAVLFLVGHWLEHTEHVSPDQQFMVPDAFKMIAGQMRVYR